MEYIRSEVYNFMSPLTTIAALVRYVPKHGNLTFKARKVVIGFVNSADTNNSEKQLRFH